MTPQMNCPTFVIRLFVILAALMVIVSGAKAQEMSQYDHGTPPQHAAGVSALGSYISADLGTINLSNGSLNFKLPMGEVGGRGFWLPLTLNYSSKVWSASRGSDTDTSTPPGRTAPVVYAAYADGDFSLDLYNRVAPGWTIGAQPLLRRRSIPINPIPNTTSCGSNYMLTTLTVVLPDKGEIQLRDDLTNGAPLQSRTNGQCLVLDGNRGQRWHSTDGSGVVFISDTANGVVLGDLTGTVITADGMSYRFNNSQTGNVGLARCRSVTDRNGNKVTINYPSGTEVDYADQLGRTTKVQFGVPDPEGVYGQLALLVTLPGYQDQVRYYKVVADQMSRHYRADQNTTLPVITGDYDPLGNWGQFPGPCIRLFPNSYGKYDEFIYNQIVITQLALPDRRTLSFAYNQFGEVAEVVMPTGGKVQYDYASTTGLPAGGSQVFETTSGAPIDSNVRTIDRAVVARRTYPDGANAEGAWNYSYGPQSVGGASFPCAEVTARAGSSAGTVLMNERHFFLPSQRYIARAPGLGPNGPPDGTGYNLWSTGVEWRSETRNGVGGSVIVASEQDWAQRSALGWSGLTTYAQEQPENDNRVSESRKILDDGSIARVRTTYDASGDPHKNNPVDVKEFDFDQTQKRHTTTSYVTASAYMGDSVHLLELVSTQSVFNTTSATPSAQTTYEYDNYVADAGNHLPLQSYGVVTGHTEATFGTGYVTRGNPTMISRMVTGATFINTFARYGVLGNVVSMKDGRGNIAEISYQDDFGDGGNPGFNQAGQSTFSLPTRVTSPPPNAGEAQQVAKSDGSVARYDYLPYGEELGAGVGSRTVAMGFGVADSTRQKFTGKERDNESGLDYFQARYYSSSRGRFTSADPITVTPPRMVDPQQLNLYVYVRNNPYVYIDPNGMVIDLSRLSKDDLEKWKRIVELVNRKDGKGNYLNPKLHEEYDRLQSDRRTFFIENHSFGERSGTIGETIITKHNGKDDFSEAVIQIDFKKAKNTENTTAADMVADFNKFEKLLGGGEKEVDARRAEVFGHEAGHAIYDLSDPAEAVKTQLLLSERDAALKALPMKNKYPLPPDVANKMAAVDRALIPEERFAQQTEKIVNGELRATLKRK